MGKLDLGTSTRAQFLECLGDSTPQTSNIKKLETIKSEMQACKTAEEKARYEEKQAQVAKDKELQNEKDAKRDALFFGVGAGVALFCTALPAPGVAAAGAATATLVNLVSQKNGAAA